MSDIPIEMYREILRRVPVEDLFKLRSVCKTWRDIISNSAFVKQHIHRGIGEDWLIVRYNTGGEIYLFPLKEMISKKMTSIKLVLATNITNLVGHGVPHIHGISAPSCNGLILISSCNKNMFWRIWNPFTREFLELGKCDGFAKDTREKESLPYSGIGYDEATDDYKVVRIVEFHTYIYSVNSKAWRRIDDFPFPGSSIFRKDGIFAYGALHWVSYSGVINNGEGSIAIIALDLNTGKYRKVHIPSEIAETGYIPILVALNECLFIFISRLRGYFHLWMIKGYGGEETWVKMISMAVGFRWSPIAYLKSKERILLRADNKQICCWYDLVNRSTEHMLMKVIPQIDDLDDDPFTYEPYSCQVLPASLVRLVASDGVASDGAGVSVASEGESKRKRKRTMPNKRVTVKITFGGDEDVQ